MSARLASPKAAASGVHTIPGPWEHLLIQETGQRETKQNFILHFYK